MYRIAVLGEKDSVIGFSALGLDVFPVENDEQAKEKLHAITKETDQYAIIYITETYFAALETEVAKFKDLPAPAIIFIPGLGGSLGLGAKIIDEAVDRAVGTSII